MKLPADGDRAWFGFRISGEFGDDLTLASGIDEIFLARRTWFHLLAV
jgi:hypothetical protein